MNSSAQDTILNTLGEKIANQEMLLIQKDTNAQYLQRQLDEREQRIKDGTKANEAQSKRISEQSAEIARLSRELQAAEDHLARQIKVNQTAEKVIEDHKEALRQERAVTVDMEKQIQFYRMGDSPTPSWFGGEIIREIDSGKYPGRGADPAHLARGMADLVFNSLQGAVLAWRDVIRTGKEHPKATREAVIKACAKIAATAFVIADTVNAWEPHKDKLVEISTEEKNTDA